MGRHHLVVDVSGVTQGNKKVGVCAGAREKCVEVAVLALQASRSRTARETDKVIYKGTATGRQNKPLLSGKKQCIYI
jgi:hypothetical protein